MSVAAGLGEEDAEGVAFGGSEDDADDEDVADGPEVWRDVVVVAVAEALAEEEARPLAVDVGFLLEGDGRGAGATAGAPPADADGRGEGVADAEFPL
ncbi:hypothetical protein [Streptomyces lonegramiae]|uniref:Uncharacterized protein n=1 Tax=Streptomyces lonegramiae TaxID=3075524 RepID=A0ABU2XW52_9ACTN|nr:hypothetical protein [Streptomyces sp. DSM 41529]MDT0550111.1 hypothetical protein [Streptomyces sp. DSM 41529]